MVAYQLAECQSTLLDSTRRKYSASVANSGPSNVRRAGRGNLSRASRIFPRMRMRVRKWAKGVWSTCPRRRTWCLHTYRLHHHRRHGFSVIIYCSTIIICYSAAVTDGFIRDTEEVNARISPTRIAIEQSSSHVYLVQVLKRENMSVLCTLHRE